MKLQHLILIGTTLLYATLFFTVPLYEYVAAYLVFGFYIALNIAEFVFRRKDQLPTIDAAPIIDMSKEELDAIVSAKKLDKNLDELIAMGVILGNEIYLSGLLGEKDDIGLVVFDAKNEKQIDLANKIQDINEGKYEEKN